jgi:heptosyltransferase-2
MFGWHNPIHTLPVVEPVANELAQEYAELPLARRLRGLRKVALRELGLLAHGQRRRRVEAIPGDVDSMLWVYTATSIGAAIMDLAPRVLVPRHVEIDLLIAPALAPLFAFDRRLRQVHTDPNALPYDIDFILLDSLRATSLGLKTKRYTDWRFASMRCHNVGDRFDRVAFADRRIRQLFGLPLADVAAPTLDLGDGGGTVFEEERFRVAVPLGTRVARRSYPHWKDVLRRIVSAWPEGLARPQFRFFGSGNSARKELAGIGKDFVAEHGSDELDHTDLRQSALWLAECDAFIGIEGSLMHVAVGVGTPGLALFVRGDPAYSLRAAGTMRWLGGDAEPAEPEAAKVAGAFLAALPQFAREHRLETAV